MRQTFTFLLLSGLALCSARVCAQTQLIQHFAGSTVITTTGDTLRGPLVLHVDKNVLMVTMPDGAIKTFPASSIAVFAVKGSLSHYNADPQSKQLNRQMRGGSPWEMTADHPAFIPKHHIGKFDTTEVRVYRTYLWQKKRAYTRPTPVFFEELVTGPVSLLQREMLVLGNPNGLYSVARAKMPMAGETRPKLYLYTKDKFVQLVHPKSQLKKHYGQQAKQLIQYARANNLTFVFPHHLAQIIAYSNSLAASAKNE
ncbi:hypothetical protein [Hymenobacter latericus]|uniref:hypothetical protein n=1 Tax=Hymenobacter sp. YIM 151858-1 TaxID=2987688 RepID=UPI0022270CE9|nr:hypothetical protein [Hymenobacter sp. YIM 151858-1]UYZ60378.1 hypothetical protein OIS50_06145 [Hymenobacter sp. YIM 151858-1]